ncbi:MAG: hypothetical protein GC150_00295 [Rhizobiales bacterium]|nr:hypothetical protein [Hyphomicrobiales bacterium]
MERPVLNVGGIIFLYLISCVLLVTEWPDSWWEAVDPSVIVECRSEFGASVVIGFSPWLGRIRYDGSRITGDVTSGSVAFRFRNVNHESCEWTVSRVSGEADLRCDGKAKTDTSVSVFTCVRKDKVLF